MQHQMLVLLLEVHEGVASCSGHPKFTCHPVERLFWLGLFWSYWVLESNNISTLKQIPSSSFFIRSHTVIRRQTPWCRVPWEAHSRSTSQEISRLLWNPEVITVFTRARHGYESNSHTPYLVQYTHFNIIPSSTHTSPEWVVSFLPAFQQIFKAFISPCVLHTPSILYSLIWSS
jgi:hypothetical protein